MLKTVYTYLKEARRFIIVIECKVHVVRFKLLVQKVNCLQHKKCLVYTYHFGLCAEYGQTLSLIPHVELQVTSLSRLIPSQIPLYTPHINV